MLDAIAINRYSKNMNTTLRNFEVVAHKAATGWATTDARRWALRSAARVLGLSFSLETDEWSLARARECQRLARRLEVAA